MSFEDEGLSLNSLVARAQRLNTPCVSDALDALGISGGLLGIRPIVTKGRFCGPAFTVRYGTCGVSPGTVGDYVDDVPPGHVVVLDNRGRLDCTVWGSLLSLAASKRGLAGTVINGVCRDVEGLIETGYPIYSLGTYMVTGKGRVQVEAMQEPVEVSGLRIAPGDLLFADSTGAIRIPRERFVDVIAKAEEIEAAEGKIDKMVREGTALREARQRNNYHRLQSRR